MTYKESITEAMAVLAQDPRRVFIGYGLLKGRAMGTLAGVPEAQILETPVAENLMMGLAIGLSLKGRLPVVYFERMDFITNAMDAIVNHLAAMDQLSRGEFKPAVIIRCTIGNRNKPLYTGPVHTQDFTTAVRLMAGIMSVRADTILAVGDYYQEAAKRQAEGKSTLIAELKDLM